MSDEENIPPAYDRFFANLIGLSNQLRVIILKVIENGYSEVNPLLIDTALLILKGMDREDILKNFITQSYDKWDKIKDRNAIFMFEHAFEIFSGLPEIYIKALKDIFNLKDSEGNYVVNDEFRNKIWKFLDSFVKISINYIHEQQGPYCKDNKPHYKYRYNNMLIDMGKLADIWGVKLFFKNT